MSTRQEKIRELLKEEISDILRRELKDPRLGFITVTDTEVSSDLRHAKVFVSVLGSEEDRKTNMEVLKRSERFIRRALGKRIQIKVLPEIHFYLDTTADHSIRMLELLEQIKHDEQNGTS